MITVKVEFNRATFAEDCREYIYGYDTDFDVELHIAELAPRVVRRIRIFYPQALLVAAAGPKDLVVVTGVPDVAEATEVLGQVLKNTLDEYFQDSDVGWAFGQSTADEFYKDPYEPHDYPWD